MSGPDAATMAIRAQSEMATGIIAAETAMTGAAVAAMDVKAALMARTTMLVRFRNPYRNRSAGRDQIGVVMAKAAVENVHACNNHPTACHRAQRCHLHLPHVNVMPGLRHGLAPTRQVSVTGQTGCRIKIQD